MFSVRRASWFDVHGLRRTVPPSRDDRARIVLKLTQFLITGFTGELADLDFNVVGAGWPLDDSRRAGSSWHMKVPRDYEDVPGAVVGKFTYGEYDDPKELWPWVEAKYNTERPVTKAFVLDYVMALIRMG